MRRAALISFVMAASFAGAFAFAAAGGDTARGIDVLAANTRTAHAASVHYAVDVTLLKAKKPMTLHIRGGSSRDRVLANLRLGTMNGTIVLNRPFLYEKAPGGVALFTDIHWLRLRMSELSERGRTLSTIRSLTPAPILHVIAEAKLHPTASRGVFTGPVAYDDPVVRTSLRDLGNGLEFRGLQLRVVVGRDGLVHGVRLTGRTADGKTTMNLRARLYGFGKPVSVTPPPAGQFMDPQLDQLPPA
jgi:hypothetical protein